MRNKLKWSEKKGADMYANMDSRTILILIPTKVTLAWGF